MRNLLNIVNVAGWATRLLRRRAARKGAAAGCKRAAALAICGAGLACAFGPGVAAATASPPSLRVDGNQLVNSSTGARFVPHGVNWPSFEYACSFGYGYSPSPQPATRSATTNWRRR